MLTVKPTIRFLSGLCLCLAAGLSSPIAAAAEPLENSATPSEGAVIDVEPVELLDQVQLQELVSPIALYSDELLAIVLPASTYPLQIVAAARYREAAAADDTLEPNPDWDESIVALLNYPEALEFLNADLDWTWRLGQAVTEQQEDLLKAVSAYRQEAYAAGNLDSDDKQTVALENQAVTIKSADPEVIYVPYYDPDEVTVYQTRRVYHYYPTAYPVYYYPYDYRHRFYDYGFWGISSIFFLSWDHYYLSHRYHSHRHHPYYARRYHHHHFRRTYRYINSHVHRKHNHYRHGNHPGYYARWQPNHRWTGARPTPRRFHHQPRHRHAERTAHNTIPHIRRNPANKKRFAEHRINPRKHRSTVHREPNREIRSVQPPATRSSVHRSARTQPHQRVDNRQRFTREIRKNSSRSGPSFKDQRETRLHKNIQRRSHRAEATRAKSHRTARQTDRPTIVRHDTRRKTARADSRKMERNPPRLSSRAHQSRQARPQTRQANRKHLRGFKQRAQRPANAGRRQHRQSGRLHSQRMASR